MLAGLCSGLTEGVFINPFEVVKVRLQTEQQQFKEVKRIKMLETQRFVPSLSD